MSKKTSREIFTVPNAWLPENFIPELPDTFSSSGEIIHNARNQIRVYNVNGRRVNVKKFCIPPIVNRILYSWGWRIPKAKKTFLNANEIVKRGFQTPQPYGYIIERNGWLINFSYFVSEQADHLKPMGYKNHPLPLIKALAAYTVQLHQKGLVHIDYTPNNILFAEQDGNFTFSLVDINRFRFYKAEVPTAAVLTNLMKPFHDDEQIKRFATEYARLRGWNAEKLCQKVLRRRYIRNFYDRAKATLKKIPGVNLFLGKNLSNRS